MRKKLAILWNRADGALCSGRLCPAPQAGGRDIPRATHTQRSPRHVAAPTQHRDPPDSRSALRQPPAHHSIATAWLGGSRTPACRHRQADPSTAPRSQTCAQRGGRTARQRIPDPLQQRAHAPTPCCSFTLVETRPGNALTAAAVCTHLLVTWNDRNGLKPSPERTENLTYKESFGIGVQLPQWFL